MNMYANLHTHSYHSDGGYSPEELVCAAKNEGYKALALTDHDTISGCEEIRKECEKYGLEFVLGIEFNAPSELLNGISAEPSVSSQFHIVALNFNPEHPPIKEYIKQLGERRTEMTRQLFVNAVKRGSIKGVEWEEILEYNKDKTWISGSQVRHALSAKGVMKLSDLTFLREVMFGKYAKDAVAPFPYRTEAEIIRLIRDAGGIAVLAHPHNQLFCVDALIEMGINGIEVHHPDLTEEEKEKAYELALEKNLFISGGSDHSGLCSGYYERFENPKECRYYREPFIYGTSKQYFDEIKNKTLDR
ncbi:MAG: PHP domain-containing protein [Oscillospiraceae bacterium]|nr:PHP domain-containing protein [Oscillospiraceae bacterium]